MTNFRSDASRQITIKYRNNNNNNSNENNNNIIVIIINTEMVYYAIYLYLTSYTLHILRSTHYMLCLRRAEGVPRHGIYIYI